MKSMIRSTKPYTVTVTPRAGRVYFTVVYARNAAQAIRFVKEDRVAMALTIPAKFTAFTPR